MIDPAKPQPAPQNGHHPDVLDLVLRDLEERARDGEAKYGVRLKPHNGRNALIDAYQEALDLCMYLRQAIYEQGQQQVEPMCGDLPLPLGGPR